MARKNFLSYFGQNLLFLLQNSITFIYQYQILSLHVDDNKVDDQYNTLLYYYIAFVLKEIKNVDKNI